MLGKAVCLERQLLTIETSAFDLIPGAREVCLERQVLTNGTAFDTPTLG